MEDGKLGHIDLARGLAILLVVLVHQAQAVGAALALDSVTSLVGEYGRMGVQLFFVASALTLCMSQSRRRDERMPLRSFYLRRFFRIAPLYYFAVALYGAVDWLGLGELGPYSPGYVMANLLFVHGFVPDAINDIVPGGWSIAGEMAFYAVFPFAYALADAVYRRWGAAPIAWSAAAAFLLYAAAWHVIPLVTRYVITPGNIFFYWPPAHVVVFWIGMAGFFVFREGRRLPLWADAAGFLLPTLISLSLWRSGYPAAFAIIPGCSALSFVFLINLLARLPERQTVFHAIGRASYSMYILHFLAVWFLAPHLIEAVAPYVRQSAVVLALTYLATVAVSFAAASVTKALIEDIGVKRGRMAIQAMRRRHAAEGQPFVAPG